VFEEQPPRPKPQPTLLRAIPPLTWIGLFFVVLAFVADDERALFIGGACLLGAAVQAILQK
jgi:hypothetical protein